MNPKDVQLIGVFGDEEDSRAFVYSVDAPVNLWVDSICDDGSRMGHQFMAYGLNMLIAEDKFNVGDSIEVKNAETEVSLFFTVGGSVEARDENIQAYQSNTDRVRKVYVTVSKKNEDIVAYDQ